MEHGVFFCWKFPKWWNIGGSHILRTPRNQWWNLRKDHQPGKKPTEIIPKWSKKCMWLGCYTLFLQSGTDKKGEKTWYLAAVHSPISGSIKIIGEKQRMWTRFICNLCRPSTRRRTGPQTRMMVVLTMYFSFQHDEEHQTQMSIGTCSYGLLFPAETFGPSSLPSFNRIDVLYYVFAFIISCLRLLCFSSFHQVFPHFPSALRQVSGRCAARWQLQSAKFLGVGFEAPIASGKHTKSYWKWP